MRPLFPGEWVALGLVLGALAADVALIRRGHEPISTCVRSSRPAKVVTAALATHLLLRVPCDPISWAGRQITRC